MNLMKLIAVVFIGLFAQTWSLCPSKCTCYKDAKHRESVYCNEGGLVGPIDLTDIGTDTKILRITAPLHNTNELTMSPVFQHYKQLEEIYITRSNIPQLGMYFFYPLTKLDILDLSQNNITQPLDHNFRGLSHLKELYLDDNRITSLPSGTFRYLQELRVLSLQRNRISELMPSIFMAIKELRWLKLSGNALEVLNPVVFEDIKELRILECRSCGLKSVEKRVYELIPRLTHLDLGENNFVHIKEDEFTPLINLQSLHVDRNRIISVAQRCLTSLHSLRKINFAHNYLRKIPHFPLNTTSLDIGYNQIEDTTNHYHHLRKIASTLHTLTLSGNRIKVAVLAEILQGLEIRTLYLSECNLIDIPPLPDTVEKLDLSGNTLTDLNAQNLPINLAELDITHNRFAGLTEPVLVRLDNLKSLLLDDNPWSCDVCHIVPMLERVNRSTTMRNVRCTHPFTVHGKKLGAVRRDELTWCTLPAYTKSDANYFLLGDDGRFGIIIASASIGLVLLVIVAVLGVVLYSRRHAAKYYTHEDKLDCSGGGGGCGEGSGGVVMIPDESYSNQSPLFGEERELSFKFPLDGVCIEKKRSPSVATIEEIKRGHES